MERQKKLGSSKKQYIDGIPTITYGWIDNKDKSKFYTSVGIHCKVDIDYQTRFIQRLESKLKVDISSLTRDYFKDNNYYIVDIDIPLNLIKTLRGYITVEVMINNKTIIPNNMIEEYNNKIVDILLEYDCLTLYKTNKY